MVTSYCADDEKSLEEAKREINECEKEKNSPSSVGESFSGDTGSSKRAKDFLSFFQSNRPVKENKEIKH